MKIWDDQTFACTQVLRGHQDIVQTIAWIYESLVSGSYDNQIIVWDLDNVSRSRVLTGHTKVIYCFLELGEGKFASGSADETIKIWDMASGHCVLTINTGHMVSKLCHITRGRFASATGCCDGVIKIWDRQSFQCLQELPGPMTETRSSVHSLAVAEDGTLLSGYYDGTIALWHEEVGVGSGDPFLRNSYA